jgi:hypothetical protein
MSLPSVVRQASRPSPRASMVPGYRGSEPPRRSSMPEVTTQPPAGTRAFGASALHDEAVLDIPAYLRRGSSQQG